MMTNKLKCFYIKLILFFTGFFLLAYEFFWVKLISISFSSSTLAISVTLAIFLAGLGLGSFFSRKYFRKSTNYFSTVALLLLLSALWNLLAFKFYPLLMYKVGVADLGHLLLCIIAVFPVTFSLGIIYPISNQAYVDIVANKKDTLITLYATEVFGSILGLLSAAQYINLNISIESFVLILFIIQIVLGAVVSCLPKQMMAYDNKRIIFNKAAFLFFVTGFAAFVLENSWVKVFNLIFGGSSQSFVIVVVSFLIGILIGTLLARRVRLRVCTVFFSLATVAAIQLLLFPQLEFLFVRIYENVNGYKQLLFITNLITVLLLLLPTVLMGISFPLLADLNADKEHLGYRLAAFYGANVLGGILGSFATGFWLLPAVGVNKSILIASFLYFSVAILVAKIEGLGLKIRLLSGLSGLALIISVSFWVPSDDDYIGLYHRNNISFENYKTEKAETDLVYSKYSSYGLVSVTEYQNKRSLRLNGRPESIEGIYEQKILAHLPVMFCSKTDNALVIGHGGGFTLSTLLLYPFNNVEVVEINKYVLEAEKYLDNGKPLQDERVKTILADGRKHLSANKTKYDLIITQTAHIWENPYLYTKEFFELVAKRLSDGGIYEIWIPRYTIDERGYKMLRKTIASVYEYGGEFVFGDFSIYIVSNRPISNNNFLSLEKIDKDIKVMKESVNQGGLTNSQFLQQFYVPNAQIEKKLSAVEYSEGTYHSDYLPILEENALKNRYRKFRN